MWRGDRGLLEDLAACASAQERQLSCLAPDSQHAHSRADRGFPPPEAAQLLPCHLAESGVEQVI